MAEAYSALAEHVRWRVACLSSAGAQSGPDGQSVLQEFITGELLPEMLFDEKIESLVLNRLLREAGSMRPTCSMARTRRSSGLAQSGTGTNKGELYCVIWIGQSWRR